MNHALGDAQHVVPFKLILSTNVISIFIICSNAMEWHCYAAARSLPRRNKSKGVCEHWTHTLHSSMRLDIGWLLVIVVDMILKLDWSINKSHIINKTSIWYRVFLSSMECYHNAWLMRGYFSGKNAWVSNNVVLPSLSLMLSYFMM